MRTCHTIKQPHTQQTPRRHICPAGTIEYAKITDTIRRGAHRTTSSPNKPVSASFHGADALNYRHPAEEAARSVGLQVEFDAVAVPPGGCVVHTQDCWHGSGPNSSRERHRRALVVHFLRGDARFIEGHSLEVCERNLLLVSIFILRTKRPQYSGYPLRYVAITYRTARHVTKEHKTLSPAKCDALMIPTKHSGILYRPFLRQHVVGSRHDTAPR